MTKDASVAFAVQPQVDTEWLALPLSARGLVDELAKYADDNARILLRLESNADARAVGSEIARLLSAHQGELARVRRDARLLLDLGVLAVDGSSIRLSRIAHETARPVERPRAMTDAERAQRCRDRKKASSDAALESSRNVTPDRDDLRDGRNGGPVTRALSLKKDLDLKSPEERRNVTALVTLARDAVPKKISEARGAKAKQLGLQDQRTHLVWEGFVAHHSGQTKTEEEWDNRWIAWVTKQLLWDSNKSSAPRKAVVQSADLDAPWMRAARGET